MSALTPFAACFETADGYSLLAGGLCPMCQQEACLRHLARLNHLSLGPSRDCVVIDVRLGQLLQQAAPPGVRFLAASVFVPCASQLCGGVAGDILSGETSADSLFSALAEGVFGFALPGAGAMLMTGLEAESRRLYESAVHMLSRLPLTRGDICAFLKESEAFSGQFLFVSDGSGGSAGCMCTHSGGHREILWLPVSAKESDFERGEDRG